MSNNSSLAKKTINGMAWKFGEKIGGQIMQFAIQIVLARLLLPEEYGLVGLLTIFMTLSDVVIQQGLTTALIQKKNADDTDFSSVFYANIVFSLILYGILFVTAPLIAIFYKEPQLTGLMRILSLSVVVGAVPAVHNAILSRDLDFKKSFFRNLSNVVTQGIVGISLACMGKGAWALVISKIAGTLVGAVVLLATVRWKPKWICSIRRIRTLFSYSSKVLITNLLNTLFNNIHSLIIGRYYTTGDLGHYQRGQQIPQTVMAALDGSMTEVLYPAFSKLQQDLQLLKRSLRKSIGLSMYIVLPVLTGLMVVAEPLTLVLLTEKWLPSVPYMQLACVVCMFWPLAHRTHALNAIGKSGVTMKLSVISKAITLVSILACLPFGIYAIMLGTICASVANLGIMSYYTNKYIGYSLRELAADVLPSLILSAVMGAAVYSISLIGLHPMLTLLIQIPAGMVIYAAGSKLLHLESFAYLLSTIKGFCGKC